MARTTRMAMRRSTLASKENFLPAGEGVRSRFSFSSRRELAATRGKVAAIREQWEQPLPVNAAANRTRGKSKHCIDQPQGSISREEHNVTMEEAATQCPAEPGQNGVPPSVACNPRGSGSVVHAAQRVLVRKHYEAKSKLEGLSGLGGGVSIWPSMDNMRLSKEDAFRLVKVCLSLVIVTIATFYWFHGVHIARLRRYTTELERFSFLHLLTSPPATGYTITSLQMDQEVFEKRLMQWHRDFLKLLASVQGDLNVELSSASLFDVAFLLVYICGVTTLLYFLLDNMLSKSRLTPRRIRAWVSLLCVVATWTLLLIYLLGCAQSLETATQSAVHSLSGELAYLVQTPLNLTHYHSVLLYWRTRVLPPTTRGVLSVMGMLQVQDVTYYLQYYSLPVLTAICTPIVKIVYSLWAVYKR